jgi:RNA polymerase sigma-70 factor, ECF subfamily
MRSGTNTLGGLAAGLGCKVSEAAARLWNSRQTRAVGAARRGSFRRRRHAARFPQAKPQDAAELHFENLAKHCNQRVYRLALRITRNHHDAEDARQETLLKAYRHMEQFEGRSRFSTWISRIAINEGLMSLRKRNDGRRVPLDNFLESETGIETPVQIRRRMDDPEQIFARGQLRGALNEAIAGLRPLYRDVFVLRAVDEFSTAETARALGVTISTVKTRLRRARRELRDSLQSCGGVAQTISRFAEQQHPEVCPAA